MAKSPSSSNRSANLTIAAFAATKLAVSLAFAPRYDWFRDELYFVSASKRLAAGYVDFLPVTPLLTRAAREVFGESLVGVRLMPALASTLFVVLVALIARELGGGRGAQALAAFAALTIPLFLGMQTTVNTVSFEAPAWALCMWLFARLIRTEDHRLWLALGGAVGLAMLTKYTLAAYLVGLIIGIVVTDARRWLRTPWPYIGAAIALATHVPSFLWQLRNGWPTLEFVSHQDTGAAILGLRGPLGFAASLPVLPGPLALPLWILGFVFLLRSPRFRALGLGIVVAFLVFFAVGGKGYYATPGLGPLVAAGSVGAAGLAERMPRRWVALLAANCLIALPITLPILPARVLANIPILYEARSDFADQFGWVELTRTVRDVHRSLPRADRSEAVVFAENYGEAAAVEFYGEQLGWNLPTAVSGHNSYYLWRPKRLEPRVLITLGFDADELSRHFRSVRRVATTTNRLGIENEEFGKSVFVVRGPRTSFGEIFDDEKAFQA